MNNAPTALYLKLLRRCLCRQLFPDGRYDGSPEGCQVHARPFDPALREDGRDWPTEAHMQAGARRLENLEQCCLTAIADDIPGDFVETGIWRGGCGILMRAALAATGEQTRKVWLFDSFQGLPMPDTSTYPLETGNTLWTYSESYLGIPLQQVRSNFEQYELLDERTRFIPGWFRDTIPSAETGPIAVLRLDGDLYESTWLVLTHFYPKVSTGGFIIIDDFRAVRCQAAVTEFRAKHAIEAPLTTIDWTGVFSHKGSSR